MAARLIRLALFFVVANGLQRADGCGSRPLTVRRGLGHDVDDRMQIPHWDSVAGGRGFASRLEAHRRLNYLRFTKRPFRHQCARPGKRLPRLDDQSIERSGSIPSLRIRRSSLSAPVSIAYVSISISEVQRHRGTESVGDCVAAIYVELALLTLFELLDEIDDSAATSTEEIAVKENPMLRA